MSDSGGKSDGEQAADRRRVRIINPASNFHNWKGTAQNIPGLMTPEDNLPVIFPSLDGPVYFRRAELEEETEE